MRTIICENSAGTRLTFPAGRSAEPFLLSNATGVLEAKADLLTQDSALTDGTAWQGSRMQKRNIVLTLRDAPGADHRANRASLFDLFRFKQRGTLVFTDGAESRQISYVVESVTADVGKASHAYTVSLLCPSPFWQSTELSRITLGGSTGLFTFPHAFPAGQASPFSTRDAARAFTVENPGASDEIGMTITLTAQGGPIRNPRIYHLQTGAYLALGSETEPLIIPAGDSIIITTGRGEKRVLSGGGENLAAYLTEDSEFLMIRQGTNTFSFAASAGDSNVMATFSWRLFYEGA